MRVLKFGEEKEEEEESAELLDRILLVLGLLGELVFSVGKALLFCFYTPFQVVFSLLPTQHSLLNSRLLCS